MSYLIGRFFQLTVVGLCYLIISLGVGEMHPFSKTPMYNNLPNYAYAFYLSNEKNELLPIADYFDYNANKLSHNYVAISEAKGIKHGFEQENAEELAYLGKQMISQILRYKRKPLPFKTLKIHRVTYYLNKQHLAQKDIVMYELELVK